VTLVVYSGSNSNNLTKPFYVSVLSETTMSFPFSESFETNSGLHGMDWFENSFDIINDWDISDNAAYTGLMSLALNNIGNTMDTKDELYSPLIDLSQTTETNISFKYAFAGKTDSIEDELQLQINKGCSTFWLNKLTINGTDLETAPPQINSFIPSSQQEWKQGVTSIPSSYFVDDFRFRFVFNGRGGNNIFIDDINIDVAAGVEENSFVENPLKLFPNPTSGKFNIVLPKNAGQAIEVKLLDSKGSLVAVFNNTTTVDISTYSSGLYFVIVETENGFCRQRVVKD